MAVDIRTLQEVSFLKNLLVPIDWLQDHLSHLVAHTQKRPFVNYAWCEFSMKFADFEMTKRFMPHSSPKSLL